MLASRHALDSEAGEVSGGIGGIKDLAVEEGLLAARGGRGGVVKPTDDEAQELMAEMQGQPQDPNAMYLQAAAEEATAKAAQARASTVKTVADAELSRAKTVQTLSDIDMDSQDHALRMAQELVPPGQLEPTPGTTVMIEPGA